MATIYDGAAGYVPTGDKRIHVGRGAIIAIIASHSEATAQTVTLYDNTEASGTVIAKLKIAPEASPAVIQLPGSYPLRFSTGLTVDAGDCDVSVIATGGSP